MWRAKNKRECKGCGASFLPLHPAHWYCVPACRSARLSGYDETVLSEFRELVKKYHLSLERVLTYITGRNFHCVGMRRFYRRQVAKGSGMSPATKNQYIMIIRKFIVDFKAGHYDISTRLVASLPQFPPRTVKEVIRRVSPRQRECPRELPHCTGGLFPGDCPRRWRDCPYS